MSRDMDLLDQDFRNRVDLVVKKCADKGVVMVPFFTRRDIFTQAKLWRQSRTTAQINRAVSKLNDEGAPWIAEALDAVGPCSGIRVTGALPGNSWHQWDLACDCYWKLDDRAEWDTDKLKFILGAPVNGYHVYQDKAAEVGLHTVTFRNGGKDWPHIQEPEGGSPADLYSWPDINEAMELKFG